MKSDNKDLREVFRAYIDPLEVDDRRSCPSLEALADSFEPGASTRKKKRIIDHMSECPACREEFRLYFNLQKIPIDTFPSAADSQAAGTAKARRPPGLPLWRFAAIVMGACLILSAIVLLIRNTEISEVERTGATGIALVYPTSSHIGSEELVFRWEAFDPSQYYIIELFDESLLPVWVSPPIKDVQARPPSEKVRDLRIGTVYFWMVTAYSGAAKTGESRLARFEVTAK
jgi:hypothetical protein